MAVSLADILASLDNGVRAINAMTAQLKATFPQATAVSTSVPSVGTITFTSSQANGFLEVITSSGATFRVALYPSS